MVGTYVAVNQGIGYIFSDDDDQGGSAAVHTGDGPVPPQAEITSRVYFDVTIDNNDAGRIVMGLYGGVVPFVGETRSIHVVPSWPTRVPSSTVSFQIL